MELSSQCRIKKSIRTSFRVCTWLGLFIFLIYDVTLWAENIVMPIQVSKESLSAWFSIKAEDRKQIEKILFNQLAKSEPTPFLQVVGEKIKLNTVQKQNLAGIQTDAKANSNFILSSERIFVPELCTVYKTGYLFIDEIDVKKYEVVSSQFLKIQNFDVKKILGSKDPSKEAGDLSAMIKSSLSSWTPSKSSAAGSKGGQQDRRALKILFDVDSDNLEESCIHSWVWRQFTSEFRTYPSKARSEVRTLMGILQVEATPVRSNRHLRYQLLDVTHQSENNVKTYSLKGLWADGVFGSELKSRRVPTTEIKVSSEGEIQSKLDDLKSFFSAQEKELSEQQLPVVVATRGAWAYLDKGLGYGLRLNDRLLAESKSGPISGHVIGYFGPYLNLKSPSGESLSEGAILYIRDNQKSLSKGLAFKYDPKTFGP